MSGCLSACFRVTDAEAEVGAGGDTLCSKRCDTIALTVSGGLSGVTDRASNSHSGACDGFGWKR
jgi:hypothetical protein